MQKNIALILVAALIFSSASFYAYQILLTDNILLDKEDRILLIPTGADFKQVSDSLERNNILHDKLSFMFLSKLTGYRDHIKPGRYLLTRNMNNYQLLKKLIKGRQDPLNLVIGGMRSKEDLARRFSVKLETDSASLCKDLYDLNLIRAYGFNDTTIMAVFIQNTYQVYWTWKTKELLDLFYKEYRKFWNDERTAKATALNLSPVEVIIMASIVDAETQKNDEKPRIAGVYMNRLLAGQRLQADPTLIYGTGDFSAKRVNDYHRYHKNPYNTYRRKGLPPGPINIPAISSIDAVLNYEKHEYFFFCAKPDLSGYHLFSRTFDEHLAIAQNYWKSLDKVNIH